MGRKKKSEIPLTETEADAKVSVEQTAEPEQKEKKKKKPKKKITTVSIRRKESVARAVVQAGKGSIRVNKLAIAAIENPYVREIILEPIKMAGDKINNLDIDVLIHGGGAVGQAQAARTAIARGVVAFTKDDELKGLYLGYDRFLLVPDPRRVEPKKFKGRKARARFQKSYR
jgi:small subunit ribosomal protein S9